ncbi:hypothetical protein CJ263_06405 [Maribacter cobaltidurans]|uniref:Uncharacterized protein n=1 Tax=Maribacter cobaltidurans TaxID=1178778 RepID=A0A223V3C3_9FLAO|nr:hypothetical protein CJ263_06405 [Maribacter cobaltidurans]
MAPQRMLLGLLETVGMLSFKRIPGMLDTKKKAIVLGHQILCGTVDRSLKKQVCAFALLGRFLKWLHRILFFFVTNFFSSILDG